MCFLFFFKQLTLLNAGHYVVGEFSREKGKTEWAGKGGRKEGGGRGVW